MDSASQLNYDFDPLDPTKASPTSLSADLQLYLIKLKWKCSPSHADV